MIEVEKKFLLTKNALAVVTAGATRKGQKKFRDTYYDDSTWKLSTSDTFLRQRDDQWELKVGDSTLAPHGSRKVNRYEEVTDWPSISKRLALPQEGIPEESLSEGGYVPFATITTERQTYEKEGFTIVIDNVTYPEGDGYDVIEIELTGESLSDAEEKILAYAAKLGLPDDSVRGKLQEYCERHRPDHIEAMKAAGQIA